MKKVINYTQRRRYNKRNVKYEDVEVLDTKLADSAIQRVVEFLKRKKSENYVKIDDERKIYEFDGNFLIIEYKQKDIRNRDKQILQERIKSGKFSIYREKDGAQIPEVDFNIDYQNSYYLGIEALGVLKENETNKNKGTYKSIICNPTKYFGIKKALQSTSNQIKNITKK